MLEFAGVLVDRTWTGGLMSPERHQAYLREGLSRALQVTLIESTFATPS